MVVVFESCLLQVDGGEVEGVEQYDRRSGILSRIPPACRCPMMKMQAAFASSVPGLVVSASSVSDV